MRPALTHSAPGAVVPFDGDRFTTWVNAPFVGDGFTWWADGQYAWHQPELGLSTWQNGRLLGRAGALTGADLTTRQLVARHADADQHR